MNDERHEPRLTIERHARLPVPDSHMPQVWLLALPFASPAEKTAPSGAWLREFASTLAPDSVFCVLTSAADAAATVPELTGLLQFQLWVAIKLACPRDAGPARLPEHHAALLILSRYRAPLRHVKIRGPYTYCPACDRTTKDYGGKKHTYHEDGTLLSDVWRDLAWTPNTAPEAIAFRLAELFNQEPYRTLHVVRLAGARAAPPAEPRRIVSPAAAVLPAQLLQGDCLQALQTIPDDSVDFCFADPPYNLSKRYDTWDDSLDVVAYFAWCDRWLDELARVLRPGGTCAVLNIPQGAIRHCAHLRRSLTFQNWIVWEGLSVPVRRIMPAHYSIVCFSKGPPRPLPGRLGLAAQREFFCLRPSCVQQRRARGQDDRAPLTDLWWDIHRLKHNARRVEHPCQLPPALMQRLITLFTAPGEMVLDPFDGAGTTSLSAALLGRRYLGIELSEPYHRLAQERHALLKRGGDPFAKRRAVPRAKNSAVRRAGRVDYEVSKKTLQLEVRRIARLLGRLPTRAEVQGQGAYPIRYYDEYFLSWAEVCAATRTTGMSETRRPNA
jgi:DNA modification methylase